MAYSPGWSTIVNETVFCSTVASRSLSSRSGRGRRLEEHSRSLGLDYLVVLARQGGDGDLDVRLGPDLVGDHSQPARLRRPITRNDLLHDLNRSIGECKHVACLLPRWFWSDSRRLAASPGPELCAREAAFTREHARRMGVRTRGDNRVSRR